MDRRQVSLVARVEVPFEGNVLPGACALGDVDGDGDTELVVGNCDGKLFVYKHGAVWATHQGLGTVIAVFCRENFARADVTDIVVVNGEGRCFVLAAPEAANKEAGGLQAIASFEIAWNVTCAQIFDLYDRGRDVLVLASCDGNDETNVVACSIKRHVPRRSGVPRLTLEMVQDWAVPGAAMSMSHIRLPNLRGKLVLLGLQFNGFVSFTIEGKVFRHYFDNQGRRVADEVGMLSPNPTGASLRDSSSLVVNNSTIVFGLRWPEPRQQDPATDAKQSGPSAASSRPASSTEAATSGSASLPGTETPPSDAAADAAAAAAASAKMPSFVMKDRRLRRYLSSRSGKNEASDVSRRDLAVLCFGGTLRLESITEENPRRAFSGVANEIVWQEEHERQLFAVQSLDINGDGDPEVISCAWDGLTCIYDLKNNVVRYQFESRVQGFLAGRYSYAPGETSACFIYVTFDRSIVICHDVSACVQEIPALTLIDVLRKRGKLDFVLSALHQDSSAEDRLILREPGRLGKQARTVIYYAKLLHEQLHAPLPSSPAASTASAPDQVRAPEVAAGSPSDSAPGPPAEPPTVRGDARPQ